MTATAEPIDTGGTAAWRVLPLEVGEPRALLADGLGLLDGLGDDPTPTLRWYRSRTTAIVLGRGQRLPAPADGAVPPAGTATADGRGADGTGGAPGALPVVSRHSGGGAVLMDPGLLSLDVVVPPGHPLAAGELGAVFDRVGGAWRAALADLGVADLTVHRGPNTARRRGDARQRLLAAVCYATLGRGEVLAGGRKLVGLAQRRRRCGALVQCGLLRTWDPAPLVDLLAPRDAEAVAALGPAERAELLSAAVGLEELMGPATPDDDAVMAAVQRRLGVIDAAVW